MAFCNSACMLVASIMERIRDQALQQPPRRSQSRLLIPLHFDTRSLFELAKRTAYKKLVLH